MLLIPFLLLMFCKWYEEVDVWPVLKSFGQNGEIWCLLISIGAYCVVVGLFYLDCAYFNAYWNFKPVLVTFSLSPDTWTSFGVLFYLFGVRTLLEEFFWRTYLYKVLYENEAYYILASICASGPYAFYALIWYSWKEMLGVSLVYLIYARLGI